MGRLANALVFGVLIIATSSSALIGSLLHRYTQSKSISFVGFITSLSWWFFRVVGGPKGIQRAVGSGSWSLKEVHSLKLKSSNMVRTVVISDTHNKHKGLPQLPEGDLLIHCGDATMKGSAAEIDAFAEWFGGLPFRYKIFVPGNHDTGLVIQANDSDELLKSRKKLEDVCVVLCDETRIVAGLKIYGTPWTPFISESMKGAYQDRAGTLKSHYESMPDNLDILVSHGPPYGYGDRAFIGRHVGDRELLEVVKAKRPRFHFCGHIHEGYESLVTKEGIVFANASSTNLLYRTDHAVLTFDVPVRKENAQT